MSARVGIHAPLQYVAAELLLALQPRFARVRQRLAFWLAREGGWATPLEAMRPPDAERFQSTLARCAIARVDLVPQAWAETIRAMFAASGAPAPEATSPLPALRLQIGGPGWEGFRFDPRRMELFVPSPLAPPAGDELEVVVSDVERCSACATVVEVRRIQDAAPGAPAGFTLALAREAGAVRARLAEGCRPRASARAAPRYRVAYPARLATSGVEQLTYGTNDAFIQDYVRNLSFGGAFVESERPRKLGERVELELRLPDDRELHVSGTVVHCSDRGVGVQFAPAAEARAMLAAAVTSLSGRPRRVLVVDDDPLVRVIVADALEARGFEALEASDGREALRAIADQLLTLDAVVTDVRMPGLSGDGLVSAVRSAGGEQDLVLVAMTATLDDELASGLLAVGADRVVRKDAGAAAVVAALEAALEERARAPAERTRLAAR